MKTAPMAPMLSPVVQPTLQYPLKLATAYVPFQTMAQIYNPMVGLHRGTIFPELDRPYGVDPEYVVDQ